MRVYKPCLLIIVGLLSFVASAESAPTTARTIDEMLTRMAKAVVHVEGTTETGDTYYGSAVAALKTPTETAFLTAGHVITPAKVLKISFAGVDYPMLSSGLIPESDAGWFKTVAIPGIEPLDMNLDPSAATVNSVAFGYWGEAGQELKLTGTFGTASRKVIDRIYNDQDNKVLRGMIVCTHLVYHGYSGGVAVDSDLKIVGINSILSPHYSLAVDIRYIWNHIPWKTGESVSFSTEDNFNEIGTKGNGLERLRVAPQDKFTRTDGTAITTATVEDIMRAVRAELALGTRSFSRSLIFGFQAATIPLGGKTYRVVGVKFIGTNKIGFTMVRAQPRKYLLLMETGFQVVIFLSE